MPALSRHATQAGASLRARSASVHASREKVHRRSGSRRSPCKAHHHGLPGGGHREAAPVGTRFPQRFPELQRGSACAHPPLQLGARSAGHEACSVAFHSAFFWGVGRGGSSAPRRGRRGGSRGTAERWASAPCGSPARGGASKVPPRERGGARREDPHGSKQEGGVVPKFSTTYQRLFKQRGPGPDGALVSEWNASGLRAGPGRGMLARVLRLEEGWLSGRKHLI